MAIGCWECHGTAGQGGNATGPQIGPDPLPWPAFIQQLRHPAEDMPPFGKAILSNEQAADLWAYLAAQKKTQAKDVPMLRP
jgi:mono/diheme cytochrome c family protein